MTDKERGLAIVEAFRTSHFFEQYYGTTEAETESILNSLTERIKDIEQEPCEDVISRDAVEEIINDIRDCISVEGYWAILERMKKLPPVNPQPKTGHWMDDEFGSKCSCCGIHTHLDKFDRPMKFKYCSMCGAKMVEPQESEGDNT